MLNPIPSLSAYSAANGTLPVTPVSGQQKELIGVKPSDREQDLTRQLDAHLNDQLNRIRQQVAAKPADNSEQGLGNIVDILA